MNDEGSLGNNNAWKTTCHNKKKISTAKGEEDQE